MEQGKQGIMVAKLSLDKNPIRLLQVRLRELESGFKSWLSKQPLIIEAGVVTAGSAAQGAVIGGFMGTLANDVSPPMTGPFSPPQASLNPDTMTPFKQAQGLAAGPLVQARNFAVMTGVNAGISCAMKRLRGKEDIESSMLAAFGSGAMFSLVSGLGAAPNPALNAVSSGLFFALVQGGIFKVGQMLNKPPVEDKNYAKTRSLLNNIGLQKYEKHFKKGLLTDDTLPLLTDSVLREVRIPPGPRLLILDHIGRDPELMEKRRSHG